MRNPTIRDVARTAGVGIGTVSRVLNNSPRVSPGTRQRVFDAIQTLDFKPNRAARQLALGARARNIGVILPFVTSHSFIERLRGVQQALAEWENRFDLVLYNVSSQQRYEEQLAVVAHRHLTEGILVLTLLVSLQQEALLTDAGIPFVGLGDVRVTTGSIIGLDNIAGGRVATEHLLEMGHRRIAYVGDAFPNDYGFPTGQDRYAGYVEALAACGLAVDPDYVRLGPHGRDVAQYLTQQLLDLPERPTAIFAMSDIQALGALAAIREAGLAVPGDISVIGFDDIETSHYIGLTTVRQHLQLGGYLAMRHLLRMIEGETPGPVPALPPLELVQRETTAPPRE